MPLHAAHAGEEGHEGANEREEAAEKDRKVTPLVEEGLALLDALRGHGLDLAGRDDALAEEVADEEVRLIADDRGGPHHEQEVDDVERARGLMGEDAGGEEQGVAGEEGHEDHAGLDEDDQEDEAVGVKRAHGDPARDGGARVFEQF